MKPAFMIEVFVRSDLPLNADRTLEILRLNYIVLGDNPPNQGAIEAFANAHTRNCGLVAFTVEPIDIPDDIL
jgi:hypothetical protein